MTIEMGRMQTERRMLKKRMMMMLRDRATEQLTPMLLLTHVMVTRGRPPTGPHYEHAARVSHSGRP